MMTQNTHQFTVCFIRCHVLILLGEKPLKYNMPLTTTNAVRMFKIHNSQWICLKTLLSLESTLIFSKGLPTERKLVSIFWWKLFSAKLNRWIKFFTLTNIYDVPKDSRLLIKSPGCLFPVRRVGNNLMDMTNEWSLCYHMLRSTCIIGSLFIYSSDIYLMIGHSQLWTHIEYQCLKSFPLQLRTKKSDTSCVLLA